MYVYVYIYICICMCVVVCCRVVMCVVVCCRVVLSVVFFLDTSKSNFSWSLGSVLYMKYPHIARGQQSVLFPAFMCDMTHSECDMKCPRIARAQQSVIFLLLLWCVWKPWSDSGNVIDISLHFAMSSIFPFTFTLELAMVPRGAFLISRQWTERRGGPSTPGYISAEISRTLSEIALTRKCTGNSPEISALYHRGGKSSGTRQPSATARSFATRQ